MLQYDFEESIGYWLVLSSQTYLRALNTELAPHGLTMRQSQVLGWLALEGPLTQNELATRMMIEPLGEPGISAICRLPLEVDETENKGEKLLPPSTE